jgi:hypothetical protein
LPTTGKLGDAVGRISSFEIDIFTYCFGEGKAQMLRRPTQGGKKLLPPEDCGTASAREG